MSNIGSASGQNGDNAAPPQPCRKRNSPNSGSAKQESSTTTTSVAAVGSSSSKLRRVAHSSSEQNPENSDLLQQNTQLPGTSGTGSVGAARGRAGSGAGRTGHEGTRGELKYLTDFFPDQNPGNRRLTRSQRQFSLPGSSSHTTDNIDHSAITGSASTLAEQPSGRDRGRGRRGRASVAGRTAATGESLRTVTGGTEQQPSTSSSARTRAHNPATGLCSSIARCESAVNRVAPSSSVQQSEQSGYRSAPQLSVVVQEATDGTNIQNTPADSSNAATVTTAATVAAVNTNASAATGAAELSRAVNGDVHVPENHSSQFRNLQRSQAVHTASSFLGALVPRVQHLLGSAHSHPNLENLVPSGSGNAEGQGYSPAGPSYFDWTGLTAVGGGNSGGVGRGSELPQLQAGNVPPLFQQNLNIARGQDIGFLGMPTDYTGFGAFNPNIFGGPSSSGGSERMPFPGQMMPSNDTDFGTLDPNVFGVPSSGVSEPIPPRGQMPSSDTDFGTLNPNVFGVPRSDVSEPIPPRGQMPSNDTDFGTLNPNVFGVPRSDVSEPIPPHGQMPSNYTDFGTINPNVFGVPRSGVSEPIPPRGQMPSSFGAFNPNIFGGPRSGVSEPMPPRGQMPSSFGAFNPNIFGGPRSGVSEPMPPRGQMPSNSTGIGPVNTNIFGGQGSSVSGRVPFLEQMFLNYAGFDAMNMNIFGGQGSGISGSTPFSAQISSIFGDVARWLDTVGGPARGRSQSVPAGQTGTRQAIGNRRSEQAAAAIAAASALGPTNSQGTAWDRFHARVVTIMEGLRSTNEISQAEAASRLAEMLLLGNEESLPNLPVKDIVHALIVLLQKEHNFELMLTAARCLSNMLEALPRALPIVIDAVPHLLEKLKRIECIDVAEQSLMALEVMSKRNGKNIMAAGGIAATISHVDFFSVPSQRLAFQIAANCATYVTANDFAQVRESLADLTQRLLIEDKRCLESVCVLFCRLVDNMRNHTDKLREIAGQNHALLKNVQQLLLVQPCAVGPNTFQMLIRMLRTMASRCSDLAVALVKMDFARTIKFLIVGSKEGEHSTFEVVSRPPQHLQELVYLAGELMQRLPTDGIFEIDSVMSRSQSTFNDVQPAQWYWKDNSNQWLPFSHFDSRLIEAAHATNESELNLQINGNVYKIDLQRMVQQNLATGNERAIQRHASVFKSKSPAEEEDRRLELMKAEPALLEQVVQLLLPILVEIDGSSSGPALRYESLRVMLRMIYPSDIRVLKDVLANLPLAGHIASALANPRSKDLCVAASALQLAHLLLDKFPDMYEPLFKREGVAHEIEKLSKMKLESPVSLPPVQSSPAALASEQDAAAAVRTRSGAKTRTSSEMAEGIPSAPKQNMVTRNRNATTQLSTAAATSSSSSGEAGPSSNNAATRVIVSPSGGRHRRKASPESPISRKESRRKATTSNFLHSLRLPSFRMPGTSSSSAGHSPHESTSPSTTFTSFFASIGQSQSTSAHHYPSGSTGSISAPASAHPCSSRGRLSTYTPAMVGSSYSTVLMQSSSSGHASFVLPVSPTGSALNHQQREKVRQWIRKDAEYLMQTYFSTPSAGADGAVPSLLTRMTAVAAALASDKDVGSAPLTEFKTILLENDVSAFELNHSGVLNSLCTYLTSTSATHQPPRKLRLKRFAAVFMSLHPDNLRPADESECWTAFETLVTKLLGSIAQHEQFQVKVTDMGGILTGSSAGSLRGAQALRFFQTHQIRCNLKRHPTCRDLKEWRHGHGSIKVDPFTSISAIERYLLDRGIGYVRGEDSSGDEDGSDDDEMPSEGSVSGTNAQPSRIEILINDEKVPGHMSILQALRQFGQVNLGDNADQLTVATSLWVNTHTLYYRAAAPLQPEASEESAPPAASSKAPTKTEKREKRAKIDEKLWIDGDIPVSECPLDRYLVVTLPVELDDPSVPSLVLLRCLYGLNRFWWTLFDDEDVPPTSHAPLLPSTAFHSSKLNAKMGRQLSDFLSVATQQIPKWTGDLIKAVPFIFTFSSRRNYLYCTAFGRDRALMHLVNQTDGGQVEGESGRLTPRLERRKVTVRRDDLLRQAEQTLHHLGTSRAMLEVGFEGEAGTGFGPTLEFYSTVSREIQKASLRLWHGRTVAAVIDKDGPMMNYTVATGGLYPAAYSSHSAKQRDARLKKFEFIGRLLAQALIDARMLDIPLNPVFFKWLCGEDKMFGLSDLEVFDKHLYQSLRALVLTDPDDFDSLEQYFTLPGDENFELIKGGKNRAVTSSNALQFVKLVAHWQLVEGVRREMEAVRKGFETIISINDLASFTPDEMEELFCGCSEETWKRTWSESVLQSAIKPDHGYTHDSEQIRWLIQMLASFDNQQQRKFLQFVTGSPKLPVGGFRSLNPPLTVVKKSGSYGNGDEELPSAMTCYNYLKIPAYSSYEVFQKRFEVALRFIYSFHLT